MSTAAARRWRTHKSLLDEIARSHLITWSEHRRPMIEKLFSFDVHHCTLPVDSVADRWQRRRIPRDFVFLLSLQIAQNWWSTVVLQSLECCRLAPHHRRRPRLSNLGRRTQSPKEATRRRCRRNVEEDDLVIWVRLGLGSGQVLGPIDSIQISPKEYQVGLVYVRSDPTRALVAHPKAVISAAWRHSSNLLSWMTILFQEGQFTRKLLKNCVSTTENITLSYIIMPKALYSRVDVQITNMTYLTLGSDLNYVKIAYIRWEKVAVMTVVRLLSWLPSRKLTILHRFYPLLLAHTLLTFKRSLLGLSLSISTLFFSLDFNNPSFSLSFDIRSATTYKSRLDFFENK